MNATNYTTYQLVSRADLFQIFRFNQQQVAQGVQSIKEIRNKFNLKLFNALAIFIHVAYRAHSTGGIKLKLLQMIINDFMKSDSQFLESGI